MCVYSTARACYTAENIYTTICSMHIVISICIFVYIYIYIYIYIIHVRYANIVVIFWPVNTAMDCNILQHICVTHCNTLQYTAGRCNILQHTVTPCNTLQHTATQQECSDLPLSFAATATHCNMLQHTATHCTTLHHTMDALTSKH